jgi:hypothetical protein
MTSYLKRKTLFLFGLVILIMVMIAASLPNLELQPGMPLPSLEDNRVVVVQAEEQPLEAVSINTFFIVLVVLMLVGTMLYALYKLLRGADRKSIFVLIRSMFVVGLVTISVSYLILLLPKSEISAPAELLLPTAEPPVTAPLGAVPPLLLWLVGITLLALSLLVGVWIFVSSRPVKPITLIGFEAEKAWQALKTGLNLKEVIIQCYRQMSLAVEKEQGIERKNFMTTGEFENLLEAAGIPREPIHQLTRLFEAVRYGNWEPNPTDEQRAIQCLEAIMLHRRGHGKGLK